MQISRTSNFQQTRPQTTVNVQVPSPMQAAESMDRFMGTTTGKMVTCGTLGTSLALGVALLNHSESIAGSALVGGVIGVGAGAFLDFMINM